MFIVQRSFRGRSFTSDLFRQILLGFHIAPINGAYPPECRPAKHVVPAGQKPVRYFAATKTTQPGEPAIEESVMWPTLPPRMPQVLILILLPATSPAKYQKSDLLAKKRSERSPTLH